MLEVFKGNNTDRITIIGNNVDFSDAGWRADLYILDKENAYILAIPAKPMIKAGDGKSFYVQIDPSETADLEEKKYLMAIMVKNDSSNFKKDIYDDLIIRKSLIPTPDAVAPVLSSWTLNMTTGHLVLTFNEIVKVNTLNASCIKLLDAKDSLNNYTLTGGTTTSLNGTSVDIALTTTDKAAIIAIAGLAKDINTSYVSITAGLIKDMQYNSVTAILDADAIQASAYTA